MRTLLLDGDILAYKVANAAQEVTQFPGCEPHIELHDWDDVVRHAMDCVADVLEQLGGDRIVMCLSVPTAEGWRVGVLPNYKAHRDPKAKPPLLGRVKEMLASSWPSYTRPTLEADDVMGILSTHAHLIKGEKVIVSDDKDMQTIPGLWFKPGWVGGGSAIPRLVSREEADYYHLYQSLIGDSTDGYTGCPGVGPVRARAVLDKSATWDAVVEAYVARGKTEEDALVQARVARICRNTDYDFTNKAVRLWTPASPRRPEDATA